MHWRKETALIAGAVLTVTAVILAVQGTAGDSTTTRTQEGWRNKSWKPPASATRVPPQPAAVAAKMLLDKNSLRPWEGRWSKETGLCQQGFEGKTSKSYTGTPAQIAERFLTEYRPLVTGLSPGKDPGDITFRMEQFEEDRDYNVIFTKEFYKGVPVYQGGTNIHIDKQGHIIGLWGKTYCIDSLDVTPALDSAAACAALKAAILPDSIRGFGPMTSPAIRSHMVGGFGHVRLTVLPGQPPRLVYDVMAAVWSNGMPDSYAFFVDARTGELLSSSRLTRDYRTWRGDAHPRHDPPGTGNASHFDSSGHELRPYYRNVPIRRVPQGEWDSIKGQRQPGADSVKVPYDTTRPNPRPYQIGADSQRRKEEASARRTASKSMLGPETFVWFWSAAYISDVDWDGDGFDARAIFEWDADTWSSSLAIKVLIYGRDYWNNVVMLRETPYYTIYGAQADIYWTDVWCPYRSLWDFRLVALDTWNNVVGTLDYGEAPEDGFPIPEDIEMERIQEDAVFINTTFDPPDHSACTDMDNDGYAICTDLFFKVRVLYDSTYTLTAAVFARDTANGTLFLSESYEFSVDYNNNDILDFWINPFPGMHSRWDFRIELWADYCQDYCLLSSVPYDLVSGLTDVPLERWNEDPRVNTVFRPNPIHSQNDQTLWDQDDADFAVPDAAYKTVTLSHLDPPSGGLYYLRGDYAGIEEIESPWIPPPVSTDGLFPFFRGDDGFEAVMCYQWIDRAQVYLQSLGFLNAYNLQIPVDHHGRNGIDNSWFFPGEPLGTGYLAFGDGGTDGAEDADVILHEYGHAIIDNLVQGTLRGATPHGEEWAMEEGFGDYWGASWTDSFYVTGFPSVYWAEWDSRATMGSPPFRRRLDSDKHYPDDMVGEEHDDGEIWSACLWEIMNAIGKRPTDSITLQSFAIMRLRGLTNPTFGEAAQCVIAADFTSYGGRHKWTLENIFWNRGITICPCPAEVNENNLKTGVASGGSLELDVCNDGRFASWDAHGGLWRFADSSSSIFDGSLLVAHGPQSWGDTVVYHHFYNRNDPGQSGFLPMGDMRIDTAKYGTNHGYAKACARLATKDSAVGVAVEWIFPQNSDSDEFVLARYTFFSHFGPVYITSPTRENVVAGVVADLDVVPASRYGLVQSGVENQSGGDLLKGLVWQQGADTAGHVIPPPNPLYTAERYRGGVEYIGPGSLIGALVGSVQDIQPGGGPKSEWLYRTLVSLSGISTPTLPDTDMYAIMTIAKGKQLGNPHKALQVVVALLSDTTSEASFKTTADKARAYAAAIGLVSGNTNFCHGDPQCDGVSSVQDVVKTVDVMAGGYPPVFDPGFRYERTDVNCDGATSIQDVVKVVNVAFRGGTVQANFCFPLCP